MTRTPSTRSTAGPWLAFTLSRRSESCLARLPDEELPNILRHASRRYGTSLHCLARTAQALMQQGLHDRETERLMALANVHGLTAD